VYKIVLRPVLRSRKSDWKCKQTCSWALFWNAKFWWHAFSGL